MRPIWILVLAGCATAEAPSQQGPATQQHLEQGLTFTFSTTDVEIRAEHWTVELTPTAWGRVGNLGPMSFSAPVTDGALVRYPGEGVEVWYLNEPRGLEQGFEVLERPDGAGPIEIEVVLRSDLQPVWRAEGIDFRDGQGIRARYDGLFVIDAAGTLLDSSLDLDCESGCRAVLTFDDTGAEYPITVDPVMFGTLTTLPQDFTGTGSGVAISNDVAVSFGAGNDAEVHRYALGQWTHEQSVTPSASTSGRPRLDGDILVIPLSTGADVFEHSGGSWSHLQTLPIAGGGSAFFGTWVDVDGTRIAMGTPKGFQVFERQGATFAQVGQYDHVGFNFSSYTVAIWDDQVAGYLPNTGAIQTYELGGGFVGPTPVSVTPTPSTQLQMEQGRMVLWDQSFVRRGSWMADGTVPYTGGGNTMSLSTGRVLYGDPSSATITLFERDNTGWLQRDVRTESFAQFGLHVGLDQTRGIVQDAANSAHVVDLACITAEIEDNGIDEDCDGFDANCHTGSCGDNLVITEFMYAPQNGTLSDGVWIEVRNRGSTTTDLKDMAFEVSSFFGFQTYTVTGNVVASPGESLVFAASADPADNGGIAVDAALPGLMIPFASGTIRARANDGTLMDEVVYEAAFSTSALGAHGASISLDPIHSTATANDVPQHWCDGRTAFGNGDFGTPGDTNDSCTLTLMLDIDYQLATPPHVDIDAMPVTFALDRTFSTGNGGAGTYQRSTTAAGQEWSWTYDGTGVTFSGVQAFGTNCVSGGTMSNLPAFATSGVWDDPSCP